MSASGSQSSGRKPAARSDASTPASILSVLSFASVNGKVTVLKAGAQWDVLGVNDVGDEIHATPALSGGRIYVRTRDALYCFGDAAKS